jgi:hypothetical protein
MFSCNKEDVPNKEEEPLPQMYSLSLSGTVTSSNWDDLGASSFKLQLIKGDVSLVSFDENYTHPNAQIFVTEKNKNSFEFNNLQEGKYTLVATKSGYKVSGKMIEIKQNAPNVTTVNMEKSGITEKIQILNEDGDNLSEINIYRYTTTSVFFYLYNGKGTNESYSISHRHYEGYLAHYFIIDGRSTLVESNWIKEIKPRNGTLKPNEIKLIEVVIDPFLYLLKEHSKCDIGINGELKVELSY